MTEPTDKSFETNTQPSNFQQRFDAITSRQLDVDTLDTYASAALDDLTELVHEVVATDWAEANLVLTSLEQERRALAKVGFEPDVVERTLDHISKIDDSIQRLDELVKRKVKTVQRVLVPPSSEKTIVTPNDGSFEESTKRIPKLKTLLLLLEKGFDIDIESDKQVEITEGVLRPGMMRSASYDLVKIPSLDRIVLVCDETGNATFVFDTEVCEQYDTNQDDIMGYSKPELDDLLAIDARLGTRIDYTKNYASRLTSALTEPFSKDAALSDEIEVTLLKSAIERVPKGYLSQNKIGITYNVANATVKKAIDSLENKLGEAEIYNFGGFQAVGYSPVQVEQIGQRLQEMGVLVERAPEGYLSEKQISEKYNTGLVKKVIAELGEELGEVRSYRFGDGHTYYAVGYSPVQVEQIGQRLQEMGVLVERMPEEYLSEHRISKEYGVSERLIKKAVTDIGDTLGTVKKYKTGKIFAIGYSPRQIQMIMEYIDADKVPAGYLSLTGMKWQYKTGPLTLKKAIDALGDNLGDIKEYRSQSGYKQHFSPDQQKAILEWIDTHTASRLGEAALMFLHRSPGDH